MRREGGARRRYLRSVTTGVADDHDRRARRLVARKSGFSRSGYCKATGDVLDDGGACSARDECRVFHNSSFGRNFIKFSSPFYRLN